MTNALVTETDCHARHQSLLTEIRGIRAVVDAHDAHRHRLVEVVEDLNKRLLIDNGRKSIVTQLREVRDMVTVPKYAKLPWVQLFKIVFVRSTWAVMLFLAAVAVTPVGQQILASLARQWGLLA